MQTKFPPEVKKRFADILQKKRKQRKLSEDDVAFFIGLKHGKTVSGWENGMTIPGTRHLFALSALYETRFEKLCKPLWDFLKIKHKDFIDDCRRLHRREASKKRAQMNP